MLADRTRSYFIEEWIFGSTLKTTRVSSIGAGF
jgi:hypothetical protein